VLAAGLLLLAGWHLLFPAAVAVVALAVGVLSATARRRSIGRRRSARRTL